MAGRPLRRLLIAELERRALDRGHDGPLEVVYEWVAGGRTLRELSHDVSKKVGQFISPGVISLYTNSTPEGKQMMREARAIAAALLAEEALEIMDDADEDKNAIAKAKGQVELRTWLASRWNRKEYGNDQAQVNVNLNVGQLHLDALRQRAVPATALPALTSGHSKELPSGDDISDAEVEEIESHYGEDTSPVDSSP